MIFRSSLAIAFLAFAAVSSSQTAAPKITFSTVAVPVDRALEEISKQAKTKLTASPIVARDVIIVSAKNASLDDLKAQIAKACSGRWEQVEGGEMLLPDLAFRRQEEQKERNEYTAALASSLKKLVDSLNPPKETAAAKEGPQGAPEMRMFMGGGASGRAVIKLAQAIGAPSLATIDERSRVVYSSHPTRMQRALPPTTASVLRQLVVDHNKEVQARLKAKAEAPPVPENEQMKRMREMFGDFDRDEPVEGTPTKAILICSRQAMFGGLTLNLKVYNDRGKVVISGQQMISAGDSLFESMGDVEFGPDGLPREKPKPQVGRNEKPIVFSASTKELMEMSNIMTMSSSPAKMNEELKAKLLNPESHDPLSFYHSEALLAVASQRGKSLVAVLPDEMDAFMSMMMPKAEAVTPSSYLESVKDSTTIEQQGDFITIRPAKPAKARAERVDRQALGTFLRSVTSKGSVSLDDLAAYAQKSNSPMEDTGAMMYFMVFAPNAIQSGLGGMVSWDMLRFYGALAPLQRKNMADGGRMLFNQLNPAQSAAVRQMVFGPEEALVADDPNAKKPEFELPSFMVGMMGGMGNDYRTEPTEVMPNGLPSNGYIELKVAKDTIAKPTGNVPAMFGNAFLGADELAMLKMFKDMPGMEQMSAFMPNIDEVKLGERSVYDFKFTVAPGVSMQKSLNDDRISASAPTVRMGNLPSDFAKKIDERLAAFKKMPFFDPAFMNPQRGTPPPAN